MTSETTSMFASFEMQRRQEARLDWLRMTSDLLASSAREGTAAEQEPRRHVLLVGRTRYQLPLNPSLRPKFDALRRALDLHVLASAAPAAAEPSQSFELV